MDQTASTIGRKVFLRKSLIVLLTLGSIISFVSKLTTIKKDDSSAVFGVDFISFYTAAKLIQEGEPQAIYAEVTDDFSIVHSGKFYDTAREAGFHVTPTRYLYLPLFLVPCKLLTSFSFPAAANLWLLLNLCCILGVMVLQWYFTRALPHPMIRLMAIVALNLFSFPLFYALKLGQTSIIIYLVVCFIYYFTIKNQDILAGILLGIITALKFSPVLLMFYLLCIKRYALVISCIMTVLIIFLTSVITFGLPLHVIYLNYLLKLSRIGIAAWSNQSADAFVLRLLTRNTILSFAPMTIPVFFSCARYSITLALIAMMYLYLRKDTRSHHQKLCPLEFSAIILCLLIMPSISWLHYYSLAILPAILMVTSCMDRYPYLTGRVLFLTVLSYSLISFHLPSDVVVASCGQNLFAKVVISFPFLGACVMLITAMLLMKAQPQLFEHRH